MRISGFTALAIILIVSRPSASTIRYTHDPAGRLIGADYGGNRTLNYVYDNAGNLLQVSGPADTTPPEVTSVAGTDLRSLLVSFDEPIDAATLGAAANYAISDGVTITTVTPGETRTSVLLNLSVALTVGRQYTLMLSNLKDAFGNVVPAGTSFPFMIELENRPPVAQCHNVIVSANGLCQADVTAAQVDNGSHDPDSDPLQMPLTPAGPYRLGTTDVTLTVNDGKGETTFCKATVTVIDQTPPTISCPPNVTVQSIPPADFAGGTVTDHCDPTPTVTLLSEVANGLDPTTITRTYRATDANGNSASCDQIITVIGVRIGANYTFIGGSGTDKTGWDNENNWSPKGVPGPGDSASISGDRTIVDLGSARTISQLALEGAATLRNGTLTVTNSMAHSGILENVTLIISVGASVAVTNSHPGLASTIQWSGGTIVSNFGSINVRGRPGFDRSQPPKQFVNLGEFVMNDGAGLIGALTTPFVNIGTIRKLGGSGQATINQMALFNRGKIEVGSGQLVFDDCQTIGSGTISLPTSNSVALFRKRQLTFENGTTSSGPGRVDAYSIALTVNGRSVLEELILGSSLDGPGDLVINRRLDWEGGTAAGTGLIIIQPTATCFLSSPDTLRFVRTVNNLGTVHWQKGILLLEDQADPSKEVRFHNRGTFIATGGSDIRGAKARFVNEVGAIFRKTGNENAIISAVFDNSGTVESASGNVRFFQPLEIRPAGTMFLSGGTISGSRLTLFERSSITGSGELNFTSIDNQSGTMLPGQSPGVLSMSANYGQGREAQMWLELGGLGTENQDQVRIAGHATLDGELRVDVINGFTPSLGQAFPVLTYGSHKGAFTRLHGLDLLNGLSLDPVYGATGLTLVVTNRAQVTAPKLVIGRAQDKGLTLAWPPELTDFVLQISTNLLEWLPVAEPVSNPYVIDFSGGPGAYYRMIRNEP
ncbi:MAG: Ig-like domain-containing protein [Verrucomicrobiales bacterium]|nr:Ig-like domain-containing protein [Verrucomicrobiales bacterium]